MYIFRPKILHHSAINLSSFDCSYDRLIIRELLKSINYVKIEEFDLCDQETFNICYS